MDFWNILRFTGRINTAGYLWNLLVKRSYREFGSKKIRKVLNSKKKMTGLDGERAQRTVQSFRKGRTFLQKEKIPFSPKGD